MARRRKTSEELQAAGAKPGRIAKRLAEEQAAGITSPPPEEPIPSEAFSNLVIRIAHERNTFARRIIPDQTVTLNFDNSVFSWPIGHPLTVAWDYATEVTSGKIIVGALTKLAAKRFLDDLTTGASHHLYIDPEAAENIFTWFTEFNLPGLHLQPWQVWVLVQMFSWKRVDGTRRFREIWFEIAKKNGKTTMMAGIALFMLLADGEPKAEIYTAANSRDQARICFRTAKQILEECVNLRYTAKILQHSIHNQLSFYRALSADAKSVDGPNVAGALFDEAHEFSQTSLVDKLTAGTIARSQPLTLFATTAGESQSGFAWDRHEFFVRLLTGVAPDDTKLVLIYALDEGDDFKDETVWKKANPNLGVTVKVEALRDLVKEIENFPQKLTPFLRYHLNSWNTLGASHTLPIEKINACGTGPFDESLSPLELRRGFLERCKDWFCTGGFDLGIVNDLTAFVAFYHDVRPPKMTADEPPYWVAVPYFWVPEKTVAEKTKRWNVPLDVWVRDGWVKTTPGDYVSIKEIKADLIKIISTTGKFWDLGFDSWNAQTLMSELNDEKVVKCTRVPQQESYITQPAQELIRAVVNVRLVHLKNPVLTWMLGNVVLNENDRGGIIAKKLNDNEKIDGVQGLLNAIQRFLNPDEKDKFRLYSVYNTRGMAVL